MEAHNINIRITEKIYDNNNCLIYEKNKINKAGFSSIKLNDKTFPMRSPVFNMFTQLDRGWRNASGQIPHFLCESSTPATDQNIGVVVGTDNTSVGLNNVALGARITHSDTGGLKHLSNDVLEHSTFTVDGDKWYEINDNLDFSDRIAFSSVVYDGKIWVMGGLDSTATRKNDVWSSSDGGKSWNLVTSSAAWNGREKHTSVVYDGKIWVMGGYDGTNVLNDVWSSTDGITWTSATGSAAWGVRESHISVVYDGKMWVYAGYNGTTTRYNDVWSSTDGITWSSVTSSAAWNGRQGAVGCVYDGKMWMMSGYDAVGTIRDDVWSSTDGVTWSSVTSSAAWNARYFSQLVVFDDKMWMMGGLNTSVSYNDVWSSTDGITWSSATSNAGWSARYLFGGISAKDKILMIGGFDGAYNGDLWAAINNVGIKIDRSFENTSGSTYNIRESGLLGGFPTDGTNAQLLTRDLVTIDLDDGDRLNMYYSIESAITDNLTFTENFFKIIQSGIINNTVELINTSDAGININAMSSSNAVDSTGSENDDTQGLLIGSGTTPSFSDSDLTGKHSNSIFKHYEQIYTEPYTESNKSILSFNRTFENVSGSTQNLGSWGHFVSGSGNDFMILTGTLTSGTLQDGYSLVLNVEFFAEV